jgi:hypothetical protein
MALCNWFTVVVFGHIAMCILLEVLLQLHVRCFRVSSRFVVDARVHIIHLIKGLLYLLFLPFWSVLPLVYVDSVGTGPEWVTHPKLLSYMWYVLAALSSVYVTELVGVLIPRKEVIASLHRIGMLVAIVMFTADIFTVWTFPVVMFGLGFLCTQSVIHLVLYGYQINPDPSLYRRYRLAMAWGGLAMIHFHVYYLWIMLEAPDGNKHTYILFFRILLWVMYLIEHTLQLRIFKSMFVRGWKITHRRGQRRKQRVEAGQSILEAVTRDAHTVDKTEVSTIQVDLELFDNTDSQVPKRMSVFDFL